MGYYSRFYSIDTPNYAAEDRFSSENDLENALERNGENRPRPF